MKFFFSAREFLSQEISKRTHKNKEGRVSKGAADLGWENPLFHSSGALEHI